jgi:hypothetical protein
MAALVLKEGKDMTVPRFIEWLNENFTKSKGAKFNPQDAYGYIKRGYIPPHFGCYRVSIKQNKEIGVKVVVITEVERDWYVRKED